jgi:hypothetical protein
VRAERKGVLDPAAIEVLLSQPEIVAWLGLTEGELVALLEAKESLDDEPPRAGP